MPAASENSPKTGRAVTSRKTNPKSEIRKLTWKERKELETIEERILELEDNVKRIESIFATPDFLRNMEINQPSFN